MADGRRVIRNRRFEFVGAVSLVFAAGMAVLTYIVLTSPGHSEDHPGGFTGAGRALAFFGCAVAVLTFTVYGVCALRVALVLDDTGLVIRNPYCTTKVTWESKPHFEIRNRRQDVVVQGPITTTPTYRQQGTITYRYHEIVCTSGRQHTWIAATSKMRNRNNVDDLLNELRQAGNRAPRAAAN